MPASTFPPDPFGLAPLPPLFPPFPRSKRESLSRTCSGRGPNPVLQRNRDEGGDELTGRLLFCCHRAHVISRHRVTECAFRENTCIFFFSDNGPDVNDKASKSMFGGRV